MSENLPRCNEDTHYWLSHAPGDGPTVGTPCKCGERTWTGQDADFAIHPLPWSVDEDWGAEVLDAEQERVLLLPSGDPRAYAIVRAVNGTEADSGSPLASSANDASCETQADGSCVSGGPCMHSQESTREGENEELCFACHGSKLRDEYLYGFRCLRCGNRWPKYRQEAP